jgi:NADPH:quinone reductase-like Zn-dependent oxidoreductase
MKAAIFEKPGLENLRVKHDVEQPKITDHDVLIRVKMAGVNPIDYTTVSGTRVIKPLPHIPGAETSGTVEEVGRHVKSLKRGDRVIVYNVVFDGTCDMCMSEMTCYVETEDC